MCEREWGGPIEFSHGTCGSRGIAILCPKQLDFKVVYKIKDSNGRFILIDVNFDNQNLVLVNIYAPTKDKEPEQLDFLTFIKNRLQEYMDKT